MYLLIHAGIKVNPWYNHNKTRHNENQSHVYQISCNICSLTVRHFVWSRLSGLQRATPPNWKWNVESYHSHPLTRNKPNGLPSTGPLYILRNVVHALSLHSTVTLVRVIMMIYWWFKHKEPILALRRERVIKSCPKIAHRVRQFMMTSSNGNIFRVTGPLCGEFTGPGEFPTQRSVTRSFDVFFDLRLNKRLSKQPCGWWFETPSWSLWPQCNVKGQNIEYDFNVHMLSPKLSLVDKLLVSFACILDNIIHVIINGNGLFNIITSTYRSSSVSGTGRASGLSIMSQFSSARIYNKIQIQHWKPNNYRFDAAAVIQVLNFESPRTDPSGSKNK